MTIRNGLEFSIFLSFLSFLIFVNFASANANPPIRGNSFFGENKFREIENSKKEDFRSNTDSVDRYLPKDLSGHTESRGFALVVGININGTTEFGDLKKPKDEAETMGDILLRNGYNVKVLVDEQASKQNILDALEFFSESERSKNSRILFYYSGHGTTYGGVYRNLNAEMRKSIENAHETRHGHLKGIGKSLYKDRLWKSFFMIPYQKTNPSNPSGKGIVSLVGDSDIMDILVKSGATEKIIIIDACMAREKSDIVYNPVPAYSYELERQGYMYLSTSKEKNRDGEFSPLIFDGLRCGADMIGNRDGIVSMFELINFIDWKWNAKLGEEGVRDNRIKYIVYGSGDIPLTACDKK